MTKNLYFDGFIYAPRSAFFFCAEVKRQFFFFFYGSPSSFGRDIFSKVKPEGRVIARSLLALDIMRVEKEKK